MRQDYFLIGILVYRIFACTAHELQVRLTSVTSFEELEEIYLKTIIKRSERIARGEPDRNVGLTDIRSKKDLCRYVFGSRYFDGIDEEPVDIDEPDVRFLLKCKYPDIFNTNFKKSELWPTRRRNIACCRCCLNKRNRFNFKYEYKNASEVRNVADNAEYNGLKENVFRCLVRERQQSQSIREYFVSEEVDINVQEDGSYSDYMAARFIFTLNAEELLVLNALAEEPALTFSKGPRNLERLYSFLREIRDPKRSAREDPLCKMRTFEKLRICMSVSSSSEYKDRFIFFPDSRNVQHNCKKQEISFQTDEVTKRQKRPSVEYKEWMIACSVTVIGERYPRILRISRGYGHNKVFVYTEIDEKVYLDSFSGRVSIFDDDNVL